MLRLTAAPQLVLGLGRPFLLTEELGEGCEGEGGCEEKCGVYRACPNARLESSLSADYTGEGLSCILSREYTLTLLGPIRFDDEPVSVYLGGGEGWGKLLALTVWRQCYSVETEGDPCEVCICIYG